ncbi:MAG: class I SAM-dependent methyltransferase [Frankiaceae bacterium]
MARIAPPLTVDWYSVDFPAVIDARERLILDSANGHGVGADLTDADWLNTIPADRPAVIVADGLMGFLTQDEMVSLLNRLTRHLHTGEIAFNSYTRFAVWAAKHSHGTRSVADLIRFPGSDDPREPEHWNPKLKGSRKSCSAGNPRSPSFHPPFACTIGCRRTTQPGPGKEP